MKKFNVKTYSEKHQVSSYHFFILSKGMNSGKPLKQPCPNCFIFSCRSEKEKNFYYWLIFGLWRSKAFHFYLRGSVIPFITLDELCKCISKGEMMARKDLNKFHKIVQAFKMLELQEQEYNKKLKLIETARTMIFYDMRYKPGT